MSKRTLSFKIDCGDHTCASESGKWCEHIGNRRAGTIMICTLFADGRDVTTDLADKDGWIQRCDACKKAEICNG